MHTSPVLRAMIDCLDVAAQVGCFGKSHRPEEQARKADALTKLDGLRASYPATWQLLRRLRQKGQL